MQVHTLEPLATAAVASRSVVTAATSTTDARAEQEQRERRLETDSRCLFLYALARDSFDFMMDWSDPHAELFPSKATVNEAVLQLLLDEIHSTTSHPETRYEAAKTLKDLCQLPRNRSAVAADYREQFIQGLDAMLQDQDEDIVRFAIFAIQTFASDESLRATYVRAISPVSLS